MRLERWAKRLARKRLAKEDFQRCATTEVKPEKWSQRGEPKRLARDDCQRSLSREVSPVR